MLIQRNVAAIAFSLLLFATPRAYPEHINDRNGIRHVLLISIDGMHVLEYLNCANGGSCPNLAGLRNNSLNYLRTSTSRPSDSFPGLVALVTGGTPRTVGAFYDVAYEDTVRRHSIASD